MTTHTRRTRTTGHTPRFVFWGLTVTLGVAGPVAALRAAGPGSPHVEAADTAAHAGGGVPGLRAGATGAQATTPPADRPDPGTPFDRGRAAAAAVAPPGPAPAAAPRHLSTSVSPVRSPRPGRHRAAPAAAAVSIAAVYSRPAPPPADDDAAGGPEGPIGGHRESR